MIDATELDEAAIRARLEAATPGPWVVFDMDDAEKRKDEPLNEPGQGWYWVWSEPRLPYYGAVLEPERDHPAAIGSAAINDSEGGAQEQADAEFIAHARTDVERLLAALDEARAEVAEIAATALTIDRERMAAESALAAVRALADRWAKEADERGDDDLLYTRGVANMLAAALVTPTTPEGGEDRG